MVLDTAVAALVVTNRSLKIITMPITSELLRSLVRQFYARMAPRVGSFVDRSRAKFDFDVARDLYEGLLRPVESVIGRRTELTIVPDGVLHMVPFDALVISDSESATTYALDRFTIQTATTLGSNISAKGELRDGSVVAAFGPASPLAPLAPEREAENIGSLFAGRDVVVLRGDAATEQATREHAVNAAVLHIGAHARANDREPDFAQISLAAAVDDDGLLHAYEVRELSIAGALVVLSACETAVGRVAGGEGLLSLNRAFLQAGASGVVGTLWPIGSRTNELIGVFYRNLAAGLTPSESLRKAKLAVRSRSHPNPLHWAPFIYVTRGL
jgi:CHAT domain-containing protein